MSDPIPPNRPIARPARRAARAALGALLLAGAALLAACAPAPEERLEVVTLTEAPSYYPHQTGVRWDYLPNNARLNDARLVEVVAGPAVLDGEVWILSQLGGRGIERGDYRQYRDDGVFLTRRLRIGSIIDFDPPLQELPAPGGLRVGASWGGESVATVSFPEARVEDSTSVFDLQYSYRVVDERTVSVDERRLDVFVIELTTRTFDEDGGVQDEISQQIWYAPYVGTVKTDNDYFLVESNIFSAPEETP